MSTPSKILSGSIVILVVAFGFFFFTPKAPTKLGGVYGTPAFNDYTDAAQGTTTLAAFPGVLHTLTVTTPVASSVIKVCDSATSSSCAVVVATITIPSTPITAPFTLTFDNIFNNGLTIQQSTATSTLTAEYQIN